MIGNIILILVVILIILLLLYHIAGRIGKLEDEVESLKERLKAKYE